MLQPKQAGMAMFCTPQARTHMMGSRLSVATASSRVVSVITWPVCTSLWPSTQG